MDQELDEHAVSLRIEPVRPLAFVKQIITMILVVNGAEFARLHSALREFVLDRDRIGLPEDIQLYLALYLGPISRLSGVQDSLDTNTHELHLMSEIAHPPFAYVASFDEPAPLLEVGNITGFADVPYGTRATAEIDLIVGFGHTIYPTDYRTKAQLDRDVAATALTKSGSTERTAAECAARVRQRGGTARGAAET